MTRHRPAPRTCANPLCGVAIERWQRVCNACFRRLPPEQRTALIEARRGGHFAALSRLAIAAGAWLREHEPAAETARRLGERDDDLPQIQGSAER
jgi:hypothetical protein